MLMPVRPKSPVISAMIDTYFNRERQAHVHRIFARRADGTTYYVRASQYQDKALTKTALRAFATKHNLGIAFDGLSASRAATIMRANTRYGAGWTG